VPLLHPAGGLIYHARAARLARGRWAGFRSQIEEWLFNWQPKAEGLIIVGPSAGYSLSSDWLAQFQSVVAIDFDPLAQPLFRTRHRHCRLTRWIDEDILPVSEKGIDWRPLRKRLREFPHHAILFSNVLGQVAMSSPHEDAIERSLCNLADLLTGREWASYHDRLSAPYQPTLPKDAQHRNDFELACSAFREGGEVVSHSTNRLALGLPCKTFAWECRPNYWHLIEACHATL